MAARPRWREIAEDLHTRITRDQEWQSGQQLPPEIELRAMYGGVSRNTVRDAIKWLVTRGVVASTPGKGTFVVERIDRLVVTMSPSGPHASRGETAAYVMDVKLQNREPTLTDPVVMTRRAAEKEATALDLPIGTPVVLRHQERNVDGKPWALQTSFYPKRFVAEGAVDLDFAEPIPQGVVQYLAETLGLEETRYEDLITARPPDAGEVGFFNFTSDASVSIIETSRIGFDQNNKPMRFTVTVFAADRNALKYHFGPPPQAPASEALAPDDQQQRHAVSEA